MNADSLDIPLSHLIRWTDTTIALAPHGGKVPSEVGWILAGAAVLTLLAIVGLVFLGSWAWRGFPS